MDRLLYIGDVPVESSYHGSALLHRLLANYPPDKLAILETGAPSQPPRRLPNVNYLSYPIGKQRWLNTRFHPYAIAWFSRSATRKGPKIAATLNGFECEGVLTVVHGFGWLAAADLARNHKIPLHLMVHDDWPRVADVTPGFRLWLDDAFGKVYRQAQSRICVSPAMSAAYQERYGECAEVLYPIRSKDCTEFEGPPPRIGHNHEPFTVAFAGSINSNGYIRALLKLQEALRSVRGRLLIFGPLTKSNAQQIGLDHPNTIVCGLLSATALMTRLREEADTLFVPMSFAAADRTNMEMAFPSKLADCTAAGLPLLIFGPSYCSAVRWARENSEVAEVVETEDALHHAVMRLANDPALRVALGKHALAVGRQYFTHDRVQQVFNQLLSN